MYHALSLKFICHTSDTLCNFSTSPQSDMCIFLVMTKKGLKATAIRNASQNMLNIHYDVMQYRSFPSVYYPVKQETTVSFTLTSQNQCQSAKALSELNGDWHFCILVGPDQR